ncbi:MULTISPECIES: SDR family oxidoreductase [Corallococcus]|uniref:SDR family oxidoreductase n=1 Tax=Corallococcus TaxID=83461 RepID=UPI0011810F14|nr:MULTISPECIES: SDR family oxidoreductase [Corallococcus]NBD13094.1 SDR family oxidoreductase [Corallococcus silvisoli]TSC24652.1 SDR family oxidoreductase [Corallococcus sp. Z5C101001]
MGYRSVFAPDAFAGRTILVTGAGSGIGRCTAHELASLGAHVVLVGRKPEKLARVAGELSAEGHASTQHAVDIRDEAAVRAMVAAVVEARGRIHGLVNNAGGQFPSPLSQISKKGFEAVVATNLTGGFLVAREVFTQSMSEHGGAIVNMLADAWNGMPGMGHSGAARAGMFNLTQTAAVEWASSGVRVNAVAPGWVASSGLDTYEDPGVRALIPLLRRQVPLHRLATEAEVSGAIVFLLSDVAAFITGEVIRIDGGASCNTKVFPLEEHSKSKPYDGFHLAAAPSILDGPKEQ